MQSDDAAVMRASLHDPARFEEIFGRHHARIWRYLLGLGGPGCADDVASEVFVVAFARRATFDPDRGTVSSWLYGIATNLARTRARSRARGERAMHRLQSRREPDVVDERGLSDDLEEVLRIMEQLSAPHREVLALFAWEELGYGAIAEILGVEVGTVRSRLARARAHLRELLARSGQVMTDEQPTTRP